MTKTFTQMSRVKFEELRQGILDGSLAKKWQDYEDANPDTELTKSEKVESRQLQAIVALHKNGLLSTVLDNKKWTQLYIKQDGISKFLELK